MLQCNAIQCSGMQWNGMHAIHYNAIKYNCIVMKFVQNYIFIFLLKLRKYHYSCWCCMFTRLTFCPSCKFEHWYGCSVGDCYFWLHSLLLLHAHQDELFVLPIGLSIEIIFKHIVVAAIGHFWELRLNSLFCFLFVDIERSEVLF